MTTDTTADYGKLAHVLSEARAQAARSRAIIATLPDRSVVGLAPSLGSVQHAAA